MSWLFSLTAINALVSTLAFVLLVVLYARGRRPVAWVAMLLWFGHAALFWASVEVAREYFGYTGPSHFVSTWAAVKDLQAFITVVGFVIITYIAQRGAETDE